MNLHVIALLVHVALDLLALLQFAGLVAELRESGLKLLLVGLGRVIDDGHGLVLHAGEDVLHTLLKAQFILDLVLAVGTMHLRCGGDDERIVGALSVGGSTHGCQHHSKE